MPDARGHIELDRALDSISVGVRHRKDPGDLVPLMESIERLGLLQPVTITPEGVLVCGWRRLEAVRRLGWRTMKVWVRSGISDKLEALLAQQDENQLHKPLNELEKASLYRELKALRAEEAECRMQATQFGASADTGDSGCASGAQPGEPGRARRQAAMAITGKASYSTHERVCALMDWASRKATPPEIRAMANDALHKIEQGEPVKPLYLKVKEAFDKSQEPQPEEETDLARLAREARERAEREVRDKGRKNLKRNHGPSSHFRSVRSFNLTWTELDGWTELYDVDALAAQLNRSDWERFDRVVTATIAFRDQLVAARRHAKTSA
ncbi:ParB N-terminal domain-containing protein [Nocardioides islandensis]|jgi:ParB family chromosome partitioning protein|uniref:ParB N-terminal domain-containing protein n=1 Tax=Nocardioides islandensis TaxID=433663 RepID=A0A930YC46_9ACTN|nr:ParB N-terminal domain-containing protein [Nocardioides islandensis]MBF4762776.1 ParB N-terminal domain-containing protein [Nocardioides islandensis]